MILETRDQREAFSFGLLTVLGLLAAWSVIVTIVWGCCHSGNPKNPWWSDRVSYLHEYWVMSVWAGIGIAGVGIIVGVISGIVWLFSTWIDNGANRTRKEREADAVRNLLKSVS